MDANMLKMLRFKEGLCFLYCCLLNHYYVDIWHVFVVILHPVLHCSALNKHTKLKKNCTNYCLFCSFTSYWSTIFCVIVIKNSGNAYDYWRTKGMTSNWKYWCFQLLNCEFTFQKKSCHLKIQRSCTNLLTPVSVSKVSADSLLILILCGIITTRESSMHVDFNI